VADHSRLDLDGNVVLATVHTANAAHHLGDDSHVAHVRLDGGGLLQDTVHFHGGCLSLAQLLQVSDLGQGRSAGEFPACARAQQVHGLFRGQAKKAFQVLVDAFERITNPESHDEGKKVKEGTALERTNENCFRTRLDCPRCKQEWGTSIDGLPPYAYTFMMTGLKPYHCSTCLTSDYHNGVEKAHRSPQRCRRAFGNIKRNRVT